MMSLEDVKTKLPDWPAKDQKSLAIEIAKNLSEKDNADVARQANIPISPGIADKVWLIIIQSFAFVFLVSFLTMAGYIYLGKAIETLLTVFTTVTAFLAGLLTPSPVQRGGSSGGG